METKESSGRWKDALLLGFVISFLNRPNHNDYDCIKYPEPIKTEISVDINRDSLEDFINKDGTVLVMLVDGTYKPLEEIRQSELDSAYARINAKYIFNPERLRNSVDNMDYSVKTGRYVLGD